MNIKTNSGLKIRNTIGGIHIFNRETGTNVLLDEFSPTPDLFPLAPRQVSIALTNACDLSCEYCYAPKKPAVLSLVDLKPWLIELNKLGTMGVGFGGGEPTLYPSLAKLCAFTMAETDLAVSITTHAHRLTDKLLDDLAGGVNFIRVSMDGIGKTYELNRGRSFSKLIERIQALAKITPFGINFIVNSSTVNELEKAVQLATDLGASEFLLLPEVPTHSRSGIDFRTKTLLRRWIRSYRGSLRLAISKRESRDFPICDPLWFESELESFAHIDAMGWLKKNSYDSFGIRIDGSGVRVALQKLKSTSRRVAV